MDALASHLEGLERRLLDSGVRASPQQAGEMLADGFREFGKSGRVWLRDEIIAAMAEERQSLDYRLEDFTLNRLGEDFALVTYACIVKAAGGVENKALRSSVWQCEADGQWRMLFHQGTKSA